MSTAALRPVRAADTEASSDMGQARPDSASTWRAFVGDWDDGPDLSRSPSLNERGMTWEAARSALRVELAELEDFDCPHCATAAREGLARLDALTPETSFECSVDRDEYVLASEPAAA